MPKCGLCSKEVMYVGKYIVDPKPNYYLPKNSGPNVVSFITAKGIENRGELVHRDGLKGYKKHVCPYKQAILF